jgi:hypothetical protein
VDAVVVISVDRLVDVPVVVEAAACTDCVVTKPYSL